MSAHTKRTLRTVVQVLLALATVAPDLAANMPDGVIATQLVVVAAIVTRWFHLLEKIPGFPGWLRLDPT